MSQIRRCGFLWAVLALLAASAAQGALSAADVAKLGDPEYAVRHATMRKLLADDSVTAQEVMAAYKAAPKPEQKHRLIALARHHLMRQAMQRDFPLPNRVEVNAPRIGGALGLTHGPVPADELPQLKQSGVRVRRTLPGFPAHAALEVGDLILAIEENPLPPGFSAEAISRYFGEAVQAVEAGRTVKLTVHRDGKSIDVKVTLAPYAALSMYQPTGLESRYEMLWAAFHERMVEGK